MAWNEYKMWRHNLVTDIKYKKCKHISTKQWMFSRNIKNRLVKYPKQKAF